MTLKLDVREVDKHVGRDLGHSDWHTVTQEQINDFARVTGDRQWMHVDIERANREMGSTIAHGLLIACLMPEMQGQLIEMVGYTQGYSYGFDKLRFSNTVKPGQRVRLHQTIKSVTPKGADGRLVNLLSVMEIEGEDKPAVVADYVGLYYGADAVQPA